MRKLIFAFCRQITRVGTTIAKIYHIRKLVLIYLPFYIHFPGVYGESNLFEIEPINITSPNGGETWQRGTSHTINWDYTVNPDILKVKIMFLKGVTEVDTIASDVPIGSDGKGSYTWPISSTGLIGSDYKVSINATTVYEPSFNGYTDTSNNYFTLTSATSTPSITVTAPTCGETWQPGTSHTVKWSYTGSPGSTVKLVLLNSGVAVGTMTSSTSTGTGGTGSYTWTISSTRASGNDYQVLVQSVSQPTVKGTSCSFTIGQPSTTATIKVTSPNSAVVWKRGTTHPVTWTYTGNPGSYVKIELLQAGTPVGTATYSTPTAPGSYA